MKRTLSALLLALTLLTGCTSGTRTEVPVLPSADSAATSASTAAVQPTEPTQPAPVYDAAPVLSDTAITIDGTLLQGCYVSGDVRLLQLDEYAALRGMSLSTVSGRTAALPAADPAVQADLFSCQLLSNETTVVFSNGSDRMLRGDSVTQLSCRPVYDGTCWYVPVQDFLLAEGYTEFDDTEENHRYYTTLPDVQAIPDGYNVPVLMYHAVSDNCWGIEELFVSPSELEAQLKYLTENGYTPIWFEDLPNVANYEKPVILTFDDGYDDNYTELFPLLQKYNVKATIFCIGNAFSTPHKMSAAQIRTLSDSGLVSIQSHAMTHADLDKLDGESVEYELSQSQLELLRVTGRQPFVLCYPTGYFSEVSLALTEKYYSFGLIMGGGMYTTGMNRYLVPRFYISRYTGIGSFAAKLG
jgi:peptidoglycan/xylan/chitin deacetylase (PgdA/CDA1 family)